MAPNTQPGQTPNVVVHNPTVRRVANVVLGVLLLVVPTLGLIQGNSDLDFSSWLPALTTVTMYLAGIFGIAVTTPNVPTFK